MYTAVVITRTGFRVYGSTKFEVTPKGGARAGSSITSFLCVSGSRFSTSLYQLCPDFRNFLGAVDGLHNES